MEVAIAGALIQLPFNIASDIQEMERRGKSDKEIKAAIFEAHGIDIPDEALMQVKAGNIAQRGDIQSDPQLRGTQLDALRKMSQIGAQGGMDAQSQAALQQAQYASQKQLQDNSASMMRQQMARGTADSGSAMAANLANGQASANMLNRAGVQAAGDARSRALQAIASSGQMAGNIRAGDFGEAESNRDAWNKIEEFNEKAKMAAQQGTADNLLKRSGAQANRAGAILNAAQVYAEAGKGAGKSTRQMGQDILNPLQVGDKLNSGGK